MSQFSFLGVIFLLLKNVAAMSECLDWEGHAVKVGEDYRPRKSDPCTNCRCSESGLPEFCQSIACSPQSCKEGYAPQKIPDTCCDHDCIKTDTNSTSGAGDVPVTTVSDGITNLSLRLVASTITCFLVLALLLFMVHRLRQRRLLISMRRMNADLGIGSDDSEMHQEPFAMDMQCPPYEAPPPPYSPPKATSHIQTNDAPPPYNVLEDLENNNQCPISENTANVQSPTSDLTFGSLFNHDRTRLTIDLDESARVEDACSKRERNMPRHAVINDTLLRNCAQISCETSPESVINSPVGHILPHLCGDVEVPEQESPSHLEQSGECAINLSDHSQTCVKLSLSVCDSSHNDCLTNSANSFNSKEKLSLVTLSYLSPESLANLSDQYIATVISPNNSNVSSRFRHTTVSSSPRKNTLRGDRQASSGHNVAGTSTLAKDRCNSEPVTSANCKYIKSILNPNHVRRSMDPSSVPHRSSTQLRSLGVGASPRPVRISYVEVLDEPHHSADTSHSNGDCETLKRSSSPKKKIIIKDSKDKTKYAIQNNSVSMTTSIDLSSKPKYVSSPKITAYAELALNKESLASSATNHELKVGESSVSPRQSHVEVSPIHDLRSPISVNPLSSLPLEDHLRSDLIAPAVSLMSICSETGEKRLSRKAMTKADSPSDDSNCNSNVWSTLVNSSVNAADISSPKEVASVSTTPVNADAPKLKEAKFLATSDCCNSSVLPSVELLGQVHQLPRRPWSTEVRTPEWNDVPINVTHRDEVNKKEKHRNKRFSTGCMPPIKLRKTNVTRDDVINGYAHLLPVSKESSHQDITATNYRRHCDNLRRICNEKAERSIKDYGFVDDVGAVDHDQTQEGREWNIHAKPLNTSANEFRDKVREVYATNQRNRSNNQRKAICKSNYIKRKLHEGIPDNEINGKRTYKDLIYSKRAPMPKADCPKEESSRHICPKTISNEKTPKYLQENSHEVAMSMSEWDRKYTITTFRTAPKELLQKADVQLSMTSSKSAKNYQTAANYSALPQKKLPSACVIMLPAHLLSPESNVTLPTFPATDKHSGDQQMRWNLQNCSYV